ncbi:MAG: hypothetical protein E7675_00315 [Ruminococcaceae bacterium]|nr:hypothetical protein [Oscillospiraceae bacterium]
MSVPSWLLIGVDTVEIWGKVEDILNLLELKGVEYSDLLVNCGGVEIKLPLYKSMGVKRYFKSMGYTVRIKKRQGLPTLFLRLLKRPGIIVGMAVFTLSMCFYGSFVFDIKVNGNSRLSDKYIMDALSNSGFGVGSYIPSIDFDELSNKVPIGYGDISWIFVNMMGNVAYVEVREFDGNEKDKEVLTEGPTDLVATVEGQIYRFEVSSGIAKASIGETVTKGQILVSGWEKGEKGEIITKSKGRVFAKVVKRIYVKQPMETEEESLVSKQLVKKYVNFLGFEINLLKNSGNFDGSCDIIEESRKLTLPDKTELPLVIREIYAVQKEKKPRTFTEDEAKTAAEIEFEKSFFSELEGADVLRIEKKEYTENNCYVIEANVYCIVEISEEVLSVRENTGGEEKEKT